MHREQEMNTPHNHPDHVSTVPARRDAVGRVGKAAETQFHGLGFGIRNALNRLADHDGDDDGSMAIDRLSHGIGMPAI